ncbi:putative protein FAR1-RELATED SEQUENCE 10 [Phalaenopsis equestris]|uniref:putative protein FAR1-RELATED SEQUENCE 10 n=1 Tax=Phalaenopsis equestris TaxID=78828 RepID=UPI0009E6599F|nr:putative protein FAR1-RELATED SEQUENCE 10 [Phalaenopsis equestris]
MPEVDFSMNVEMPEVSMNALVFLVYLSSEATHVCNDPIAEKFLSSIIHNEEEAYESYRAYAHHVGFTVRKDHTTYWPNSKKLKVKDYICGKAGYKKEPNNTVKFRKADTRNDSKAMVRFHVGFEGNWTVAKFIENHNHPLAESGDKHLLRSNRRIRMEQEAASSRRVVDAFEQSLTDCLTQE